MFLVAFFFQSQKKRLRDITAIKASYQESVSLFLSHDPRPLVETLAAARAYGISLSTEADLLFLADLAVRYNVYKYTKTIL